MRRRTRTMGLAIGFLILAAIGVMAALRLAPSNPAVWHVDPRAGLPASGVQTLPPPGQMAEIVTRGNAAIAQMALTDQPAAVLARLDAVALAAPGTVRLAGSPAEGRITWVTRSSVWGFPDYTTAAAVAAGGFTEVTVFARSRFGRSDFGVNAARLRRWLSAL